MMNKFRGPDDINFTLVSGNLNEIAENARIEAGVKNIQSSLTTQEDQILTSMKATASSAEAGIKNIQKNLTRQNQVLASMQVTSASAEAGAMDIQNNLTVMNEHMQKANVALPRIEK